MKHPRLILATLLALLVFAHQAEAELLVWEFEIDESQVKNGPESDGSTNSTATGSGYVSYDTVTNIVSYTISWENLFADLTKLHIHGPATADASNSQHVLEIFGPPDIPAEIDLRTDTWSDSFELESLVQGSVTLTPEDIINIMQSGLAYVNVHTESFGMGEIRGNLGLPVGVPEPTTITLLAAASMALLPRRRGYARRG